MSDLFGIVVSGLLMLFVIFRAIQLDSTTPWFQPHKKPAASDDPANGKTRGTARHGRPNRAS